jgi:hypothetical protein
VQGIALSEQDWKRLADTYLHLTTNPLNVGGGGSVADLHVRGGQDDALFHVRDKAARLLQVKMLREGGQTDTAENRMTLREVLWESAAIETAEGILPSSAAPTEGE